MEITRSQHLNRHNKVAASGRMIYTAEDGESPRHSWSTLPASPSTSPGKPECFFYSPGSSNSSANSRQIGATNHYLVAICMIHYTIKAMVRTMPWPLADLSNATSTVWPVRFSQVIGMGTGRGGDCSLSCLDGFG